MHGWTAALCRYIVYTTENMTSAFLNAHTLAAVWKHRALSIVLQKYDRKRNRPIRSKSIKTWSSMLLYSPNLILLGICEIPFEILSAITSFDFPSISFIPFCTPFPFFLLLCPPCHLVRSIQTKLKRTQKTILYVQRNFWYTYRVTLYTLAYLQKEFWQYGQH